MRLHVLSDLHLEQEPFSPPPTDADAVILAGDTAPGTAGITWAASAFQSSCPVLYLAGNHEFYGFELPGLIGDLRAAAAGTNVHLLERDELVLDGVRFLGCTLWTSFDSAGEDRRQSTMRFAERVSNDYKLIRSAAGSPLRAQHTLELHRRSRRWLTRALAEHHDGPTVVLTHHVPLIARRSESLIVQALGGSIVSDLEELIDVQLEDVWIYGHSHRATDRSHRGTRLLSNPRGYPRERTTGFAPGLVIEV